MGYSVLINKVANTGAPDFSSGVKVASRKMNVSKNGKAGAEYIQLTIGQKLAAGLHLSLDHHKLALMFGNGDEFGKMAMTVDNEKGMFSAKRNKKGQYLLSISKETAAGILLMGFETFYREKAELIKIDPAKPVFAIFDIEPALQTVYNNTGVNNE
jgi:hypothetical protein